MKYRNLEIALLVPCHNEELSIGKVIKDFRTAMPSLSIYVFDNDSNDNSAKIAEEEGATVIHVPLRGKGNVVRRMFADVSADIFVMVDGDATYDAASVIQLVDKLINEKLDMVVGCRRVGGSVRDAYRFGHQFGNWILTEGVRRIFGGSFTDMLSGYRVFSKRFVKSFPALSKGFEIETEITIHALELRIAYGELATPYGARPEGSVSKLSTFRDGFRIAKTIARIFVAERSLIFYSGCAILLALGSLILGIPVVLEFIETGLVPRLPTAVLSASLMISALLAMVCGLILDLVTRSSHETKRLFFLAIPHPSLAASPE
jgi:glycosyltransferase involved in cell wall biosynthesis